MFGASAATPGGVGWVFIATLHKLAVAVRKLAVMTYIGVARLRSSTTAKFAALPQLPETAQVTSRKTS
jgi:hypothetical protein